MARALDHLVLAYRNLDAAEARYREMGFLVSVRNRHPWGTENHVVQFDGVYLELIGLGPDYRRPVPSDPVFPFAGCIEDRLAQGEGLAMIALRCADAEAERRSFAARGWAPPPSFHFARTGLRAGRERALAFTLAFIPGEVFAAPRWFVCQHHHPENFWEPAAQAHPNGAMGIDTIGVCAEAARLTALVDTAPTGERFELGNARLTLEASFGVTIRRKAGAPLALA